MPEGSLAIMCNIMPWSSPCKLPAYITYGTAIETYVNFILILYCIVDESPLGFIEKNKLCFYVMKLSNINMKQANNEHLTTI